MKKVEVKIDALSVEKSSTGNHLIILGDGNRKISIVINPSDAQFILVKLNRINITKPFTPEIFKTVTDIYNIDITEVFIYAYEGGTFYAKALTTNGNEIYDIDCAISNALTISVLYNCPIYMADEILEREGIITTEDIKPDSIIPIKKEIKKLITSNKIKIETIPVETLNSLKEKLQEALEKEEYELAVELRDKISKLKEEKKKNKK